MASSYSDLQVYRNCPRLFGFTKLGYRSASVTEPLATSSLVHAGLAAHFKGQDARREIRVLADDILVPARTRLDIPEVYELEKTIEYAEKRANELLNRYISHWAKDYKPVLVEPEIELGGVVIHPDLIAFYGAPIEKRVVVDFKTSYHPDERWFDISNQTDLYAYVDYCRTKNWVEPEMSGIDLIVYDIISEEGIYRHVRPPHLAAGKRLFGSVQRLNESCEWISEADKDFHVRTAFLNHPHPNYTCPSRCNFFQACWILDTGSWEDCRDFLESNFL